MATSVEKRGESAMTTIPQNIKKRTKMVSSLIIKLKGDIIQHNADKKSDIIAVFFVPTDCDRCPLSTQAILPIPIIRKDKMGMLIVDSTCLELYVVSITGTNAQKA